MKTFLLELLVFALFALLCIGLYKPTFVLRWTKVPTRKKVFFYWFFGIFSTAILAVVLETDEDRIKGKIERAKNSIEKENYADAISRLKDINSNTPAPFYEEAQILLATARVEIAKKDIKEANYTNAISTLTNINSNSPLYSEVPTLLATADSLNKIADQTKRTERKTRLKKNLQETIASLQDSIDFSKYYKTIDNLQMELFLFSLWADFIKDGDKSDDLEIQELAKSLRKKLVNVQIQEFPKIRKKYAELAAEIMWEHDIKIHINGTANRDINFTGGVFSANKNKADFQEKAYKILIDFRFNRAYYRWYKSQTDEVTYWKLFEGKDSELVVFEK